jgi:dTDP-4-amino-4,6-dideoxygalactose transaminase
MIEDIFHSLTGKAAVALQKSDDAVLYGIRAWREVHKIPLGSNIIVSGLDTTPMLAAVVAAGLRPVIADIDADTLQPTVKTLQAAKIDNTVAVLVKHFAGYPCSMDEIWAWCKARRYMLMDDMSHCVPTRYKTWQNGSWPSDMTYAAFDAGSVLCSPDQSVIKIVRSFSRHVPETFQGLARRYDQSYVQWSYERRKAIWEQYTKAFEDIEELELPWEDSKQIKQSRHFYVMRGPEDFAGREKNRFDHNSNFKDVGFHDCGPLPNLYDFLNRSIFLPLDVEPSEAKTVIDTVKKKL